MSASLDAEPQPKRRLLAECNVCIDDFVFFGSPRQRESFDRRPEPIGSSPDFV
jgi:hypothetical protein